MQLGSLFQYRERIQSRYILYLALVLHILSLVSVQAGQISTSPNITPRKCEIILQEKGWAEFKIDCFSKWNNPSTNIALVAQQFQSDLEQHQKRLIDLKDFLIIIAQDPDLPEPHNICSLIAHLDIVEHRREYKWLRKYFSCQDQSQTMSERKATSLDYHAIFNTFLIGMLSIIVIVFTLRKQKRINSALSKIKCRIDELEKLDRYPKKKNPETETPKDADSETNYDIQNVPAPLFSTSTSRSLTFDEVINKLFSVTTLIEFEKVFEFIKKDIKEIQYGYLKSTGRETQSRDKSFALMLSKNGRQSNQSQWYVLLQLPYPKHKNPYLIPLGLAGNTPDYVVKNFYKPNTGSAITPNKIFKACAVKIITKEFDRVIFQVLKTGEFK